MLSVLFIVIITFGVLFVFTSSLALGLVVSVNALKAGFKGLGQSTIMMLVAKFIVFPIVLLGIASIIPFGSTGHGSEIRMALCVVALSAGAPFLPKVASLGKGNLNYALSAAMLLTILTIIILPFTLPFALSILGTGLVTSIWSVAFPLIIVVLIPLIVGMLIRARYPDMANEFLKYIRPISLVAILLHVTLYFLASLSDFTVLYLSGIFIFVIGVPLISLIIGFFLSPPFRLRSLPYTDPRRGSNITTIVSIALSNTGAIILMGVTVLAAYPLAGFAELLFTIVTIIVMVFVMAELGRRYERGTASTNKKPISNTKPPKS